ncbi:MAG: hypothetical protein JXN64_15885 [Spirochaetes bacterium]|nr:hypothetical protein [Spirochaetota bacterium]
MDQNLNSRSGALNNYPVQMFKISPFKIAGLPEIESASDDESRTERGRLILCRFCSNIITSPENIIEIDGKHNYTFTNPAGNTFRIGCFSSAEGCLNYGEPSDEYTWFPGFTWCFAMCTGCYSHLGWFYESGMSSFYGLILNNLIENI